MKIIADPAAKVARLDQVSHPQIPLPRLLFQQVDQRLNSSGIDLSDTASLSQLSQHMNAALASTWRAAPLIGGLEQAGDTRQVFDPSKRERCIGEVVEASQAHIENALSRTRRAALDWDASAVDKRAVCLERAADLLEQKMAFFIALCAREGGKTIADGIAEVREAVDFCRYYAARARIQFAPHLMPGPTGEENRWHVHGRGVFVCISPWNFPLAIFLGQISAALAAGNAVVAKPAEQTPLIATAAVKLLHSAGVPGDVLQLLPGAGDVGAALVGDARIAGVAFTGSTEVAWHINKALAAKRGPIVPLIAETGGQKRNACRFFRAS